MFLNRLYPILEKDTWETKVNNHIDTVDISSKYQLSKDSGRYKWKLDIQESMLTFHIQLLTNRELKGWAYMVWFLQEESHYHNQIHLTKNMYCQVTTQTTRNWNFQWVPDFKMKWRMLSSTWIKTQEWQTKSLKNWIICTVLMKIWKAKKAC